MDKLEAFFINDHVSIYREDRYNSNYNIYLTSEFSKPNNYHSILQLLHTANENDKFIFHISSHGGNVETGINLFHAIKSCPAQMYAHIQGPLYSLAPLLALSCDKLYIEEHVFFMFHDYSGGIIGKGNEIKAQIEATQPYYHNFFKQTVKGFLTEKEIKEILRGSDLYLNYKDLQRRLNKLGKLVEIK